MGRGRGGRGGACRRSGWVELQARGAMNRVPTDRPILTPIVDQPHPAGGVATMAARPAGSAPAGGSTQGGATHGAPAAAAKTANKVEVGPVEALEMQLSRLRAL